MEEELQIIDDNWGGSRRQERGEEERDVRAEGEEQEQERERERELER